MAIAQSSEQAEAVTDEARFDAKNLRETMARVAALPNVGGIAVGVIRDGKLVHSEYAGEASPGVPVTKDNWFNPASVSKTLIAETVLRLVNRGAMSLDDPIGTYFRHPHLTDDPRYDLLTPRIILSHQTTLRNWPYNYDDNRLAFLGEPGDGKVSYSGAAIEILMRYLEARFEATYPELVEKELLKPLGIEGVSVGRSPIVEPNVARGVNRDGEWQDAFRRSQDGTIIQESDYSAADNMFATVPGYASLLSALISKKGLSNELIAERQTIFARGSERDPGYDCPPTISYCPENLGYGLGWAVFEDGGKRVLNHGGNDFAEHAQVYFDPDSGDGLVLFMTGGNAFRHGLEVIEAIEPQNPMYRYYDALISLMQKSQGQ
ncbi:serine hydrolase domain-containing protein [Alterisphingorhabdus coralli]|uniref:Serine hydrolase domain-containing protein n=1 Tax=Alterisphingorhabdus coralli TaxID=3071408 RepID=A0AA97F9X8_9SPHN|nr:serine hydrolase domain-containing protein [Parasphingorhabdus sp. SCSIO 66989]WOE76251.1 serine hydrolase domain-containing protein [Parasphingorhabdus sp. SCSIO 66989]